MRTGKWFAGMGVLLCFCTDALAACDPVNINTRGLSVREGYVDFIPPSELKPFKDALPSVSDSEIDGLLKSADTMWYDEHSMVFLYQDSIESVVGGRANCVGREIGESNASHPQIGKLLKYFGPDFRFLFPFRKAAGTDNVTGERVLNFWAPTLESGRALPVKYWRPTSRGRWYWTFPVGTVFGEVLYQKGPDGRWYAFEIRTRKRYRDGWAVNAFRPFVTAASLADAVMALRPDWAASADLRKLVGHLQDSSTLVSKRWESKAYGTVFPPIDGALDLLPEITDTLLVSDLLTKTKFVSAEGTIWKENGALQTYAPSSQGGFSVVPKGYEIGVIPVNEVSCTRCHSETGRRLAEFEFDIQLYGEIWGEDRIFTWHLFEPHRFIFGAYDDSDGTPSRKLNSRLVQAGLIKNEKPQPADPLYKPLPSAFKPESGKHRYLERRVR